MWKSLLLTLIFFVSCQKTTIEYINHTYSISSKIDYLDEGGIFNRIKKNAGMESPDIEESKFYNKAIFINSEIDLRNNLNENIESALLTVQLSLEFNNSYKSVTISSYDHINYKVSNEYWSPNSVKTFKVKSIVNKSSGFTDDLLIHAPKAAYLVYYLKANNSIGYDEGFEIYKEDITENWIDAIK